MSYGGSPWECIEAVHDVHAPVVPRADIARKREYLLLRPWLREMIVRAYADAPWRNQTMNHGSRFTVANLTRAELGMQLVPAKQILEERPWPKALICSRRRNFPSCRDPTEE